MNRILLLEDDPGLTEGLSYALSKNGFSPDIAGSTGEARSLLFPVHSYDLLLLDVTLPDGTGFDLCAELRRKNDQTPIIFLTAADEETSVIRGLDCGGDDYITKPFKLGELCSRIRALLRRSSLSKIPEDNPRMYLGSGPVQVDCASGKAYKRGDTGTDRDGIPAALPVSASSVPDPVPRTDPGHTVGRPRKFCRR